LVLFFKKEHTSCSLVHKHYTLLFRCQDGGGTEDGGIQLKSPWAKCRNPWHMPPQINAYAKLFWADARGVSALLQLTHQSVSILHTSITIKFRRTIHA
jgi:hypothetical protein